MNEPYSSSTHPKGRHDDYEEGEIPNDADDQVYHRDGMEGTPARVDFDGRSKLYSVILSIVIITMKPGIANGMQSLDISRSFEHVNHDVGN